jgi:signal transduction histidine kinase
MTPEVQRQAFDPFFTTRRNEGGTGLGLHIVYTLVTQQFGGRMALDSRLGQGTTFRIIMPKTAKGGQAPQTKESDGISQWPNRTMSST